jgi:hypothetical protein
MKKIFSAGAMLLAAFTLTMSLTIGVVSTYPELVNADTSVVVESQQQVVEPDISEVEPSLQICKDESGQAKACDDKDLMAHLLVSVGGYKGMTALGIAFVIAKLLLLLLLSPFFTNMFPSLLKGNVKLLVATGLNLIVGLLGLMLPPVSLAFGAAVLHSSTLALASVFANQAYKQLLTSKGKA